MCFKASVDHLHTFLAYVQWIPKIHLWCYTCWSLGLQHDSRALLIHVLADHVSTSIGALLPHCELGLREERLAEEILSLDVYPLLLVCCNVNQARSDVTTLQILSVQTGVVILTDPPYLGPPPPDHFDCCKWDPFFHKCWFFGQLNYCKSINVWHMSIFN